MMGNKQKLISDEVDMIRWGDYAYLSRAGVKKRIKTGIRRRERRKYKMNIQEELLE